MSAVLIAVWIIGWVVATLGAAYLEGPEQGSVNGNPPTWFWPLFFGWFWPGFVAMALIFGLLTWVGSLNKRSAQ